MLVGVGVGGVQPIYSNKEQATACSHTSGCTGPAPLGINMAIYNDEWSESFVSYLFIYRCILSRSDYLAD